MKEVRLNKASTLQSNSPVLSPTPKTLYDWADEQFYRGRIKATHLHTLKAIINCSDSSGVCHATIDALIESRNKTSSTQMAKADPVCKRTMIRHIVIIEESIQNLEVDRLKEGYVALNTYSFNLPGISLETKRSDIMSPLIGSPLGKSKFYHHSSHSQGMLDDFQTQPNEATRADVEYLAWQESQKSKQPPPVRSINTNKPIAKLNAEEEDLYQRLRRHSVFRGTYVNWLKKHSTTTIVTALQDVLCQHAADQISNIGGTINGILSKAEPTRAEVEVAPIRINQEIEGSPPEAPRTPPKDIFKKLKDLIKCGK